MKWAVRYWYRGKSYLTEIPRPESASWYLRHVKATGAVLLYQQQAGVNAGTWFLSQILR